MTTNQRKPRRSRCPKDLTADQRLARTIKIDPLTGCHLWQGSLTASGYAQITFRGQPQVAHRLAWTLKHGPIPKGMDVCHRCDERHCINPDHHFLQTRYGNMADFRLKRRLRIQRAFADANGQGGLPANATRNEITPIRIYVRGLEIVGEAVIRPFDPTAAPQPAAASSAQPETVMRCISRRSP